MLRWDPLNPRWRKPTYVLCSERCTVEVIGIIIVFLFFCLRCQYVLELKWVNTTHAVVLWTNRKQNLYVACLHTVFDGQCREVTTPTISIYVWRDTKIRIWISRFSNKSFQKSKDRGYRAQCGTGRACSSRKTPRRCSSLPRSSTGARGSSPTLWLSTWGRPGRPLWPTARLMFTGSLPGIHLPTCCKLLLFFFF